MLAAIALPTIALAEQPFPGLSVPDLIGLTRFGTLMTGDWGGDDDVPSPDGAHTAIVVQRGVLRDNARQFSLLVFDTKRFSAQAAPLVEFATRSNRPGISQVAWLSNQTLAFLAEGVDGRPQVYTIDLGNGKAVQRSHADLPIMMFNPVADGVFAYATESPPSSSRFVPLREHGFVVAPGTPIGDVVAGNWREIAAPGSSHPVLHLVKNGQDTVVPLPDGKTYGDCGDSLDGSVTALTFSLAPSGDLALISCRPSLPRPEWSRYTEPEYRKLAGAGAGAPWWVVLDMHTGAARPLTGGPRINFQATPRWSADSKSVVVFDDFVSLDGISDEERTSRSRQRYTAEVNVETQATTPITTRKSTLVAWDSATATLTLESEPVTAAGARELVRYRNDNAGWTRIQSPSRLASRDTLQVRQGLNEPWKLVRLTPDGKVQPGVVYDPNKDLLTHRRLARETTIAWKTKSGAELIAGLYWPLNYEIGRRYPLVIQTHGFYTAKHYKARDTGDEDFAPDGVSTTGFAAQPMAAAGIMVVQAERCVKNGHMVLTGCDTPEYAALSEGNQIVESWESLIDRLDQLGLIDRSKVGLQGYSRSCYHQLYFLTHSSDSIGGMICADGVDGSYLQYMLFSTYRPQIAQEYSVMNGGAPFGPSVKKWMEHAPGFNLDHIHTPIRLFALTEGRSLLEEWEPFAGLVLQGRPVELFYLPDAEHNIVRPWERVASQQGTVDWFRFWLQGFERTEPISDAEETSKQLRAQYTRWEKLCDQQVSSNPGHPTFCVRTPN